MLTKNISIYLFSSIIISAISFIMIPIYTAYLNPSEYGIYGMILIFQIILSTFIHMNVMSLFTKNYYDNSLDVDSFLSNIMLFFFLMFCIILFFVFLFSDILLELINLKILKNWIYILVVLSYIQVMVIFYMLLLKLQNNVIEYNIISIIAITISSFLGYIFVKEFHWGWKGLIVNQLITQSLILFYFIYKNKEKKIKILKNINLSILRTYLFFGFSLLPNTLNWRIITFSDRFFITKFLSLSVLGTYTLGVQLANILTILTTSFDNAWGPYFMKEMHRKNTKDIYKYLSIYIIIILSIVLILYMIAPYIIRYVFDEKYYDTIPYFNYFILIVFMNTLHSIVSKYLVFYSYQLTISKITTLGMILNVILNYILVKDLGAIGVAKATLISYIFIVSVEVGTLVLLSKRKK